jgi:hypothetical protein
MAPDGTDVRRVTDGTLDTAQPAWSPFPWVPRCVGWLTTAAYVGDGVDPDVGPADTTFTFRVRYFQPDGELPTTALCLVQHDEAGLWADLASVPLALESGDATSGAAYVGTVPLPTGRYRHRFVFSDSRGELPGLPASFVLGPTTEPELTWVGEAEYVDRGVDPEAGRTGDTFSFRVKYANPTGEAPSSAACRLQRSESGVWQDYAVVPMELDGGDPTAGATYACSAKLPEGAYRYGFAFA